jgi:beta-lactamase class A
MKRTMRKQRYKRQQMRQRRFLLLLTVPIVTMVLLLWGVCQAWSRSSDLKVPSGFYEPSQYPLPAHAVTTNRKLTPIPWGVEHQPLRHQLLQLLGTAPAHLKPHMVYFNLDTHQYINLKGEDAVSAASVIKLPLLVAFMEQVDEGMLSLEMPISYQAFHRAAGSGELQYQDPGQVLSAQETLSRMIQQSDNTCTNMALYQLGSIDDVNTVFRRWGLRRTHMSNWLPDLEGANVISMIDMATLLYHLAEGEQLSISSRSVALEILKGTHNRRLLPALLPPDSIVAHKTGDIGTVLGDAGLFVLPDGQRYILAVQVERPYNDHSAKTLIQKVSRLVYEAHIPPETIDSPTRLSGHNGAYSPTSVKI